MKTEAYKKASIKAADAFRDIALIRNPSEEEMKKLNTNALVAILELMRVECDEMDSCMDDTLNGLDLLSYL